MKISNQLVPAFASTLLAQIALGVGIATVALTLTSTLFTQAVGAQTAPNTSGSSFPDSSRQNEKGTFGGGDFSLFDLIHRSQLGTINIDEYSQEQDQNLTNAAEAYKQRQRQLIGNPQQQLPDSPVINIEQDDQQNP